MNTKYNSDKSEKALRIGSVSGSFTKEDLQAAFSAGRKFETGEQDSEKTYNKFTGYQEPNRELDFEKWYELNYR